MAADRDLPVSSEEAAALFDDLRTSPALLLAVSGGPDSTALMWLAVRWRAELNRGPKLVAATGDHGFRPPAAGERRGVPRGARAGSASRIGPCAGPARSRRPACRRRRARRAIACSPRPRARRAPPSH